MNPVLYGDIAFEQELNAIYAKTDITPEEAEVLENALIEHEMQSVEKITGLMQYTKNLEAFQAAAKSEEERIKDRRKRAERIQNKIEQGIKTYMLAKGFDNLKAGTFALSFRKSTGVVLDDIKAVPQEYKVVTISEDLDKNKAKEALKSGQAVPGCHIEERKNLTIK